MDLDGLIWLGLLGLVPKAWFGFDGLVCYSLDWLGFLRLTLIVCLVV
jgi:hypothetical protein